jgi:sporulation protein YlmC with PRC-barrel domain
MLDEETGQVVDHSHQLISSARVEGTPIYSQQGERLGTVHSVMIHKVTGQVAYALLSFGGFLGIGAHVYPVPWEKLHYEEDRRGYVVDINREKLENAPKLDLDETDRPRESEGPMYAYWDTHPYW